MKVRHRSSKPNKGTVMDTFCKKHTLFFTTSTLLRQLPLGSTKLVLEQHLPLRRTAHQGPRAPPSRERWHLPVRAAASG